MRHTWPCIALAFISAPAFAQDPVTLLCEYGNGEFKASKNLKVDVDLKQIDGLPANFTDTTVTFDRTETDKTCHYTVNRLNGDFQYDCNQPYAVAPQPPLTGKCKKVEAKLF